MPYAARMVLRALLIVYLLVALLLLTACGGGSDPVQSCKSTVVVALYGDSTMRGQEDPASPYRPQKLLQAAMDLRFGRGAVRVDLFAFGGAEVFDLVAGTRGFTKWGPQTPYADLVVMNFGINESENGVTVERYAQGLTQITHPGLMLQTPSPVRAVDNATFAQAMRSTAAAEGHPVIEVRAYVQSLPDWSARLEDGVHPTGDLYAAIVRDVVAPAVGVRVQQLLCGSAT